MTQCEFGGLDSERIASPVMKRLRAGVSGPGVNFTVPLTGCVTLSKSLNLPEAASRCWNVETVVWVLDFFFFFTLCLSPFGLLKQNNHRLGGL